MSPHNTAIVTGAGSGIGRQTAIHLAAQGYNLVLVSRSKDTLQQTVQLATTTDHPTDTQTLILPADLCDPHTPDQIISQTLDRFARIDAIANVAGYAQITPIDQITPQAWQRCIDTNLSCVIKLTAAAWPTFTQQNRGVIVNVSSMASVDPFPGLSIYAAAKAALNMFTHATAKEGAPIGLKAVAIAPGAVETPMLRSLFDEQRLPTENALTPQEVATVICDCITDRRQFDPGQTIFIPSPAAKKKAAKNQSSS